MKTIYIHVGFHKTASTLIKTVLCHLQKVLLERFSIFFDEVLGATLSLKLRTDSPLKTEELEKIRRYMNDEEQRKAVKCVISSEGFSGTPESGYADAERIAWDIKYIAQDFDRIVIIVFVRRQDTFLESLFHQHIKTGNNITFQEFISKIDTRSFHWLRILTIYKNIFGKKNLYVFPYEALCNAPNEIVTKLLNILGAPVVYEGTLPVLNPSLSKKGLELAKFANKILNKKERSLMRNFLQENFYKSKEEGFDLFTDDQRKILIDVYRQSNKDLFDNYISEDFKTMTSIYY